MGWLKRKEPDLPYTYKPLEGEVPRGAKAAADKHEEPADAAPVEPTPQPATRSNPQKFQIHHKPLHCPICAHDQFWEEEVLLTKTLQFMPPRASALVCADCDYMLWFRD